MSRASQRERDTLADVHPDRDTVFVVSESDVYHLTDDSDECNGIHRDTTVVGKDPTLIPSQYYRLCHYCEEAHDD